MPFEFQPLEIPEVILVKARRFADERGFFLETYKKSAFAAGGIGESFVQDNFSHSARGVLRGLHYQQHPQAQGKLVQVLNGHVFDVGVDIRRGSPTYARWVGVHLTGERSELLYIPPGFAHGFCVLSETVDVTYKCTALYVPEEDAGIRWDDPDIGIDWPISEPLVSEKDRNAPLLKELTLR